MLNLRTLSPVERHMVGNFPGSLICGSLSADLSLPSRESTSPPSFVLSVNSVSLLVLCPRCWRAQGLRWSTMGPPQFHPQVSALISSQTLEQNSLQPTFFADPGNSVEDWLKYLKFLISYPTLICFSWILLHLPLRRNLRFKSRMGFRVKFLFWYSISICYKFSTCNLFHWYSEKLWEMSRRHASYMIWANQFMFSITLL